MKCRELLQINCLVFVNKLCKEYFSEPNLHIFLTLKIFFFVKFRTTIGINHEIDFENKMNY